MRSFLKQLNVNALGQSFAIFLYFFAIVHFFRTFHFASGYGWLDPWVQVGYGQAFPETAYVHHYYKESRILSITYESFILQFSPYAVNLFWECTAALTALYIYKISRSASNHPAVGILLGSLAALSPILWGDWAGGGDYYNTFGNLISVITALIVFQTVKHLLVGSPTKTIHRMAFFTGLLFAIILFETPSGIIVLLPLELILISNLLLSNESIIANRFQEARKFIYYQFKGFVSLILIETLYVILLGESPIRLLAGPKFLFDSIIDSSIQNAWAQDLALGEFLTRPNLFLFTCMFALQLANFLIVLTSPVSLKSQLRHLSNASIPILFYLFLLSLQFSEKTIVFTTSYFLTPVLIVGICFIANIQLPFPKRIVLLGTLIFSLFISQIFSTPRVLFLLFCLLLVILIFRKLHNSENVILKNAVVKTLLMAIFLVVFLPQIPLVKSPTFQVCESERINARAKIIQIAEELDSFGFKRGTLLMGADLDVMRLRLVSKCSDFDGKSLGGVLIAIAETGFPAASSLGPILIGSDVDRNDFAEDNLALMNSREVKPGGCFIEWEELRETSRIEVEFMNHTFGARLTCPILGPTG
jgi:hypothetical protein